MRTTETAKAAGLKRTAGTAEASGLRGAPEAAEADGATGTTETIQTGRTRLLRRWPSLPLLALGIGIAWRFILISDTLPIADTAASPLFYLTMLVVFLFAAASPASIRAFGRTGVALPLASVIAACGTVLILTGGDPALPLSDTAQTVCSCIGFAISGLGIGFIALRSCELLGRLTPTEIWIWLAYTELVVVGIYFATAGSPFPITAIGLIALPLLAAACLSLGDHPGSSLMLAREEREQIAIPDKLYAKFFAFVLLLSLTACFAKVVTLQEIPADMMVEGIAWPALERIAIAVCIIFGVVYFSKRFPFSKMCMFAVIMVIVALGFVVLSIPNGVIAFFATTLAHSTLECITIAFSACLVFKTRRDPYFIGGLALAALGGGSLICDILQRATALAANHPSIMTTAFFVSAALSIIISLVFFQERSFDALLGSVDEFFPRAADQPASRAGGESAGDAAMRERLKSEWGLSPRECDVVLKLEGGNTVTRIAEDMNLSVHTVRGYIKSIYGKCGVHSRNELLDFIGKLAL